jgi:hypothetical protein
MMPVTPEFEALNEIHNSKFLVDKKRTIIKLELFREAIHKNVSDVSIEGLMRKDLDLILK